ncbi:RELN-like protein [Mya arenaria]|uniref:Reelin n=1 Tax=Mya arenaria TaxID=6604 RepID=A0ABY7FYI0_MYAAR|nr:RELN-like protein [Mya arenaria]
MNNGVRELITKDMDTRRSDYLQFHLRVGGGGADCNGGKHRSHGVIVQYSNNGGVTWTLLDELEGTMSLLENVMISPKEFNPERNCSILGSAWKGSVEPLDSGVWQTATGGVIGKYCNSRNPVLILANQESDKRVVTKDLNLKVGDVIQFKCTYRKEVCRNVGLPSNAINVPAFDIAMGCDSLYNTVYGVMLEYSTNMGKLLSTWAVDNLFIGGMVMNPSSLADDFESGVPADSWLFVNDGEVAGYCEQNVRSDTVGAGETALVFRQGSDKGEHSVVTRDLNVGPMSVLQFDVPNVTSRTLRFRWYQGVIPEDDYGPEWAIDNVFIGMACMQHCLGHASKLLDEKNWDIWSGGLVSKACGLLLDGYGLVFQNSGERVLQTIKLDLSKATTVQFYIRLGCDSTPPDPATPPVYAQFTTNGGINWHTIEQFDFNEHSNKPSYVYIGGDFDGVEMLADHPGAPRDSTWTLTPGAVIEPLLYSHDKGVTWQPVTRSCLPSHLNCEKYTFPRDSEFLSDMTSGWNRYNVPLPFHTRTAPED